MLSGARHPLQSSGLLSVISTGLSVINTENNIYQEKQTGYEAIKRARVECTHAPEIISFYFCLSVFDGVIVTRVLNPKICSVPLRRR